ncbi:MAG: polymer-forming cytoskeletal protein [Pseudomonadota bacterium]
MKTVVEEDLTVEGDIKSSDGSVEVKGKVVGNVAAASVILHERGVVDGALTASSVSVEGNYKGNLKCDDLRLAATSHVNGDISARTMTTESGSKLVGKVNIVGQK